MRLLEKALWRYLIKFNQGGFLLHVGEIERLFSSNVTQFGNYRSFFLLKNKYGFISSRSFWGVELLQFGIHSKFKCYLSVFGRNIFRQTFVGFWGGKLEQQSRNYALLFIEPTSFWKIYLFHLNSLELLIVFKFHDRFLWIY